MNWTNYHMHSHYCDGKGQLEDYIKKALVKNMFAIGFSGHAPGSFILEWHMKEENLDKYLAEIDFLKKKYEKDIRVYSGLEIDYIPGIIGPNDFRKNNLDIIIGSIHYNGQFKNGENYCIDHTQKEFKRGLKTIYNNDIKKLVMSYYDNMISMINNDPPDIIGHLDKIKKHNLQNRYFNEEDSWYQNKVTEVIKAISMGNCIVELNTRGYYSGLTKEFYPSRWILEKCLEHNVPVTISSDAHRDDDIDNSFEQAASLLLDIGYGEVHVYYDGKWCPAGLRRNGLEINRAIKR